MVMNYNRKGYGIQKQYDKWHYRDPVTEELHGPFTKRDEARELAHKLQAEHANTKQSEEEKVA